MSGSDWTQHVERAKALEALVNWRIDRTAAAIATRVIENRWVIDSSYEKLKQWNNPDFLRVIREYASGKKGDDAQKFYARKLLLTLGANSADDVDTWAQLLRDNVNPYHAIQALVPAAAGGNVAAANALATALEQKDVQIRNDAIENMYHEFKAQPAPPALIESLIHAAMDADPTTTARALVILARTGEPRALAIFDEYAQKHYDSITTEWVKCFCSIREPAAKPFIEHLYIQLPMGTIQNTSFIWMMNELHCDMPQLEKARRSAESAAVEARTGKALNGITAEPDFGNDMLEIDEAPATAKIVFKNTGTNALELPKTLAVKIEIKEELSPRANLILDATAVNDTRLIKPGESVAAVMTFSLPRVVILSPPYLARVALTWTPGESADASKLLSHWRPLLFAPKLWLDVDRAHRKEAK